MRLVLLIILLASVAWASTFTIQPNSGTFSATQGTKYKLSLTVAESPPSTYWTLYYNSTGLTGGGLGLNNWATAKQNLNATTGTTFDSSNPVSIGVVRGYRAYTPTTLSFPTLLKDNLEVKTPSTTGTLIIKIKITNDLGDNKAVMYTVTVVAASPAPAVRTSIHILLALLVVCLTVLFV